MQKDKVKKPIYERWWFIVLAVIFVLIFIGSVLSIGYMIGSMGEDTDKSYEQAIVEEVEEVSVLTKEEDEYTLLLQNQFKRWSKLWDEFIDLTSQTYIGKDKWYLKLDVILQQMKDLTEEARRLNPPEKFADVNYLYMKAVDKYEVAVNILPDTMDYIDETITNELTKNFKEGNAFLDQASEVILKIIENN